MTRGPTHIESPHNGHDVRLFEVSIKSLHPIFLRRVTVRSRFTFHKLNIVLMVLHAISSVSRIAIAVKRSCVKSIGAVR